MKGARAERSKSVCFIRRLAEVIPVIAHEHDEGVLREAEPVEGVEEPANLRIES